MQKKKQVQCWSSGDRADKPTEVADVYLVKISDCLWKMGEKSKVICSRASSGEFEHYMLKGEERVLPRLFLVFLTR